MSADATRAIRRISPAAALVIRAAAAGARKPKPTPSPEQQYRKAVRQALLDGGSPHEWPTGLVDDLAATDPQVHRALTRYLLAQRRLYR